MSILTKMLHFKTVNFTHLETYLKMILQQTFSSDTPTSFFFSYLVWRSALEKTNKNKYTPHTNGKPLL